jgi:hypothetical protein
MLAKFQSFQFMGRLYRNSAEMHAAIAEEWMSAGGSNSRADVREAFDRWSDEELADEVDEAWKLSYAPEFDRRALIAAFGDVRRKSEST